MVVGIAGKVTNIANVLRSTHGITVVTPNWLVYTSSLELTATRHAQLTVHGKSIASDGGIASPLILKVFALHFFIQSVTLHLDFEKLLVNII